jgi:hypothetical protein
MRAARGTRNPCSEPKSSRPTHQSTWRPDHWQCLWALKRDAADAALRPSTSSPASPSTNHSGTSIVHSNSTQLTTHRRHRTQAAPATIVEEAVELRAYAGRQQHQDRSNSRQASADHCFHLAAAKIQRRGLPFQGLLPSVQHQLLPPSISNQPQARQYQVFLDRRLPIGPSSAQHCGSQTCRR